MGASFSLLSVRPFPLPSLPFYECAWIFDFQAKRETVLQFIFLKSVLLNTTLLCVAYFLPFMHNCVKLIDDKFCIILHKW